VAAGAIPGNGLVYRLDVAVQRLVGLQRQKGRSGGREPDESVRRRKIRTGEAVNPRKADHTAALKAAWAAASREDDIRAARDQEQQQ